jgi:hypothetical protein
MAIDTPATIAIIGAGPIGLEAALYARYLGYDVLLFERETVAAAVRRWGHLPMVTPLGTCVSKLGLAALHAQDPAWRPPALHAVITGDAWRKAYLLPLAHSDLIVDCLHEHTEVVAIRRASATPNTIATDQAPDGDAGDDDAVGDDTPGDDADDETGFRVLVRNTKTTASQYEVSADVVIDASGAVDRWGWLSGADVPLPGELAAADVIQAGLPEIRASQRAKYAGHKTLLVGGGLCALANLTALTELINAEPGTAVVWITPEPEDAAEANHPLSIAAAGNRAPVWSTFTAAVADRAPHIRHWPGASIKSLAITEEGTVRVLFDDAPQAEMAFDQIINNLRFQTRDPNFWGLPVQKSQTYEAHSVPKGGPPDIAAGHVESIYAQIARELVTREPNFYILGSKRLAQRIDDFTVGEGLNQVCALFTILGDRPNLNLYATMDKLLP